MTYGGLVGQPHAGRAPNGTPNHEESFSIRQAKSILNATRRALRGGMELSATLAKVPFASLTAGRQRTGSALYLVGSDYGRGRDENAEVLFDYLKGRGATVRFITNRVSGPDDIARGSFLSFVLFFRSRAVFFTHSLSDILPQGHRAGLVLRLAGSPCRVFIQHGIIGLKKRLRGRVLLSDYILVLERTFDYMVVSSEAEREIVVSMGVPPEKVCVTGLPRYDVMGMRAATRQVLIFFSWQDAWAYREKLEKVLVASWRKAYEENGYRIVVKRHGMMDDLAGPGSYGEGAREGLLEEIDRSSVLITDNSSVAWDFLYKGGDVVFYRPDEEWLRADARELFRDRIAMTGRDLDRIMAKLPEAEDTMLKGEERRRYFAFEDGNSCRRVFELAAGEGRR